jgi:hypothetical protein
LGVRKLLVRYRPDNIVKKIMENARLITVFISNKNEDFNYLSLKRVL